MVICLFFCITNIGHYDGYRLSLWLFTIETFLFRDWGLSSRPIQSLDKSTARQEYSPETVEGLGYKRSLLGGKEILQKVFPFREPRKFGLLIVVDIYIYVS